MERKKRERLPEDVAEALDTAPIPGSWDFREGRIHVGVNLPFTGYPLESSVVADWIEALTTVQDYLTKKEG